MGMSPSLRLVLLYHVMKSTLESNSEKLRMGMVVKHPFDMDSLK